jgi:hypothetical protein
MFFVATCGGRIVTSFRSATHGTCALDGKRPPGSKYAAECPLATRQRRSEAAVMREAAKQKAG